jgi:lactate racemase
LVGIDGPTHEVIASENTMRVVVDYQDDVLEFEVPAEQVVAAWSGPPGIDPSSVHGAVSSALESPLEFPPVRQMVVPGDHVVIALDPAIRAVGPVLEALVAELEPAGVERESVTVLSTADDTALRGVLPAGCELATHHAGDRGGLAYLAATQGGRRVYLNRLLTDADVVIPVGQLGFAPIMGYRGPWSLLFPELSDRETQVAHRARWSDSTDGTLGPVARGLLDESSEVSWLLGAQFQVGVVPGASGIAEVIAGQAGAVRDRGIASVDRLWTCEVESRAELVVVGIGGPGEQTTLDDLAHALITATRLVQRGGKIVALSRASGSAGPCLNRLAEMDDPRDGAATLRGHERDDDFLVACRLVQAISWADIFIHSRLDRDLLEGLSVFALERPEQARRLVTASGSCMFVNQAQCARGVVVAEIASRQHA